MGLNSKRKLKPRDAERFAAEEPPLWRELAAVVCSTGVLPEKEWHECWQMAQRVHETFPRHQRVVDLAAGHGLLAWILVLLGRTSAVERTAVAVDIQRPPSAETLAAAIRKRWPQWADAVHYVEGSIDAVTANQGSQTLFVANHACGSLSDRVLLAAMASHNPVAIMPCCHSHRKQAETLGILAQISGLPVPDARAGIDAFRIAALQQVGYAIREAGIAPEISGYHRIIMGLCNADLRLAAIPASVPQPIKQRGVIRAFETLPILNASDIAAVEALARRPSRLWRRSFDLSFWVSDVETARNLELALNEGVRQHLPTDATYAITTLDRYEDPEGRLAFTWRIELSSARALSKDDGLQMKKRLCETLQGNFQLRSPAVE